MPDHRTTSQHQNLTTHQGRSRCRQLPASRPRSRWSPWPLKVLELVRAALRATVQPHVYRQTLAARCRFRRNADTHVFLDRNVQSQQRCRVTAVQSNNVEVRSQWNKKPGLRVGSLLGLTFGDDARRTAAGSCRTGAGRTTCIRGSLRSLPCSIVQCSCGSLSMTNTTWRSYRSACEWPHRAYCHAALIDCCCFLGRRIVVCAERGRSCEGSCRQAMRNTLTSTSSRVERGKTTALYSRCLQQLPRLERAYGPSLHNIVPRYASTSMLAQRRR